MADVGAGVGPARVRRILAWGLACAALAFVVNAVPIRDRCEDPASPDPKAPRVTLSREGDTCVLHRREGEVRIAAPACAQLRCEPGLGSTLEGARIAPLLGLLAVYFAGTLAWAARFRALVRLAGVPIGVRSTWRLTLESQAGGILLPGGIGGDALRVGFIVGRGGDLTMVIAAVLLDRIIGLTTVAGLAAALAALYGGRELGPLGMVLGAIPIGFAVGVFVARRPLVAGSRFLNRGPVSRLARPIFTYLGDPAAPRALGTALVFSSLVSLTQLGVVRGIIAALGATPVAEPWVYLGTTMTFIVGVIPALPGGWGTSDAAFVFFLAKAGLAASIALAVGLLYRLFWYSSGAVGALLYLLRQHAAPRVPGIDKADGERIP